MELLSPGEKIKKLRMELGLKQEDITNETVSKSLISMIEKNKRGLTWNTATIIAQSLNRYYRTMGKMITPEFLMETEEDRVNREVKEEIEYLQTLIESGHINTKLIYMTFDKILKLVEQWDMKQELIELRYLKGRFYYKSYLYNKALEECSNVLEYYIEVRDYSEVARTYNFMGACYYMQMMMDQALNYYSKAYDTAIEHSTANKARIKVEAVFNIIICYRKIHRYDMALQFINMFKEIEWDNPLYEYYNNQTIILEANTYRDLRNYERSEKLYEKLMQKHKVLDKDILFLLYDNYTIFYMEQGKIQKALNYVDKAIKILKGVRPDYIPWIYITKARCLVLAGRYDEALNTLNEGLVLAEDFTENEMIIDFHFTLSQVYIKLNDFNNALMHLKDGEKIIIDNNIKLKRNDLYSFYIEVYIGLGESSKSIEYASKIRKDYLALKNTQER